MSRSEPPYSSERHELGPDIYEGLFRNVFDGDQYQCWLLEPNSWQLRIVGGPGSGKVRSTIIISACRANIQAYTYTMARPP